MIGERLVTARRMRGLTQFELAQELGDRYSQQMISLVETGKSNLLIEGLAKISSALDVSTDFLLGLTEDPRPDFQISLDEAISETGPSSTEERKQDYGPDSVEVEALTEIHAQNTGNASRPEYEKYSVSRSLLTKLAVDPRRARIVRIKGHFMSPDLSHDSLVLVDQRKRGLRDNLIYLIIINNAIHEVRRFKGLFTQEYQWQTNFFLDRDYGGQAWVENSWRKRFWEPVLKEHSLLRREDRLYEPIPHDRDTVQVVGQVRCVLEKSFDDDGW